MTGKASEEEIYDFLTFYLKKVKFQMKLLVVFMS
jgi:glucan biosynthesis protein